ncbi:AarF/ABC1/UbiB kinase family protein [Candidatus Woesearchaeota archaeon]|nr:MAG: AarF/ABC1/UbiB kinase family protein [Candidatus Woesearchaeota archaeon]
MAIVQTIRDMKRIEEIAVALAEYELHEFLMHAHLNKHLPIHHKVKALSSRIINQSLLDQRETARRLRRAMEQLGPTFIKLGQLLSLRSDLIPEVFCEEFRNLQDNVAPMPFSRVKEVVEAELGQPLNKVFSHFDREPVASASIAQVHRAVLRKEKKVVAVKVQRPHIRALIKTDIDILYHIARALEKRKEYRNYNPVGVVTEFEIYTKNEMDFEIEARNEARFHRNFEGSDIVFIPKPFLEYSTKRVLVSEWVDGTPLTNLELVKKKRIDKKKVALNGMRSVFEMIFRHRFFHADSHPGNIFILKDGRIAYVDFGIVGRVTEELRDKILELLIAVLDYDVPKVRKLFFAIAEETGQVNVNELTSRIDSIIGEWYGASLKDYRVTQMIYRLINTATRFNLKIPVDVILLAKALLTMEGTGAELYPELDFVKEAKPMLQKLWAEKYSVSEIAKRSRKEMMDFQEIAVELPAKASKLMDVMSKGELEVKLDMRDINVIREEIERESSLRTLATIFGSIILASSVLLLSDKNFSLAGIEAYKLGFLAAGAVAVLYLAVLMQHREYVSLTGGR